MEELKLRKLFRGYMLTDFDGHEIGCKDSEHVVEEIRMLLKSDGKSEKAKIEKQVMEKRGRKTKQSTIELHRKIFELAKEQIILTGKVNAAQIARDLDINASNVGVHLKKLDSELNILIKKWQEEMDKKTQNMNTVTSVNSDKPAEQ